MKAAPFDYERPSTLAEAISLLGDDNAICKVLAGGQSLGPMLNLRLVQPDLLVDITGISELTRAEEGDGAIVLGACVTHAAIEDRRVPDVTHGLLPSVASAIAYRAVRNRGTIGGSLAHADPAADWPTCLAGIGADILIRGSTGQRSLPVTDFLAGAFETALGDSEILEAVRIPKLSPNTRWGFYKFCRKPGEFAEAMASVLHDPDASRLRLAVGATHSVPTAVEDTDERFGRIGNGAWVLDPNNPLISRVLSDAGASSDAYQRSLQLTAIKRATAQLK